MKVYIEGAGCTRRKLETTKLRNYFALNGFELVNDPKKADHILVTTCAFKKDEEEYSFELLRKLERNGARILVYGCLPDISPERYNRAFPYEYLSPKNIDEIDGKFENIRYRFADIKESNIIADAVSHALWPTAVRKFFEEFEPSPAFAGRVFNYLRNSFRNRTGDYYLFTGKGCLGNCAYCAIKHAVGRIRSKPRDKVVAEFIEGVNSGYRRFILLGDDVGAYGQDMDSSFPDLLEALLTAAEDACLNRASGTSRNHDIYFFIEEIHPIWVIRFKERLLSLLASERVRNVLCPIQSGNDRILELMNRGHRACEVVDTLTGLRAKNPDVRLTTQVIVGFPTETDEEFDDTLRLLQSVRFDEVTLFPYDEKPNTEAASLNPKVPEQVIGNRIKRGIKSLRRKGCRAGLSCPT